MTVTGGETTTSGFGRGMLQLALANAAYIVTAYVVTTVTARLLGPPEFGSFGVVMAWITVLTALLVKGLATTIAREMAAGTVDAATAWRAGTGVGIRLALALAVLGIAASPAAARLLGSRELTGQFAVGALAALSFGVNAVLLAWPTGLRRYGRQAFAQVAYAVARVVLVVGGAVAFGLEGAVAGYVLAPLASSASLLMHHPPAVADPGPVRARMWRSVLPIALVSIAVTSYFVVDVFALSSVVGAASDQVGIYVAFGTVAHVPFFLLQAASVAMVPALAGSLAGVARSSAIRRTMTDTLVLLAGPTLLLAAAGDAAARVIFGAAYALDADVVRPLAIGTAAVTMLANLVAVDVAVGRLRSSLVLALAGAVLVAGGSWFAAGMAGDPAAQVAWAACAASVLAAVALALQVRIRHGALLDARRATAGVLLALVASLPPLLVQDDVARTAVAGACGVAWLAVALRLRLVDVRRSATPVAVDLADAEHA